MLFNVPDPVLDVVEAFVVGDVVDQHDAHGPSVIPGRVKRVTLDSLFGLFSKLTLW